MVDESWLAVGPARRLPSRCLPAGPPTLTDKPATFPPGFFILSPPSSRRAGHVLFQLRSLEEDRKSTRLNSSHGYISYAVFCLKKKKKNNNHVTSYVCTLPAEPA